jgi:RNA polymerase sigma-70 factor (family 1)
MKKEHFDDTKTIRLLAEGSEHAFTLIFDRYQAKVYRAAYKILKSRPLAEEIVQEVFLKVWARRIAFPEIKSLEAFLYTTARNLTIDYWRKRKVEISVAYKFAVQQNLTDLTIEHAVLDSEYEQLLQQAIDKLTPRQKTAYELSRIEGLSHQDIATRLNISDSRVNNLITKAVSTIRETLKPHIGYTFLPLLLDIFKEQ